MPGPRTIFVEHHESSVSVRGTAAAGANEFTIKALEESVMRAKLELAKRP